MCVSQILEENSIYAENTRIRKVEVHGKTKFEVLQGSIQSDDSPQELRGSVSGCSVLLIRGDHSKELAKVNEYLGEASKYAANDHQEEIHPRIPAEFPKWKHRDAQRISTDMGERY